MHSKFNKIPSTFKREMEKMPKLESTDASTVDPERPWTQQRLLNELAENDVITINKQGKIEAGQLAKNCEGKATGQEAARRTKRCTMKI